MRRTHQLLQSSSLKDETAGFFLAAQDQSLPTRKYPANVTQTQTQNADFNEKLESIDHTVAGCSVHAPTEYKTRHDRFGQYLNWDIYRQYNIPHPKNWYEYHPEPVTAGQNVIILWDYGIHADRKIYVNMPDTTIEDIRQKTYMLIDMAVPTDNNISAKEFEKLSKFKDLEFQVSRICHLKTKTIPAFVEALGMIKKGIGNFLARSLGNQQSTRLR